MQKQKFCTLPMRSKYFLMFKILQLSTVSQYAKNSRGYYKKYFEFIKYDKK